MTDYSPIIEMLKKADGPDRELDCLVYCAEHGYTKIECDPYDSAGPRYYAWRDDDKFVGELERFPTHYTASLDASIGLVERMLPGWCPFVGKNVHHGYWLCGVQRVLMDMPDGLDKRYGQHDSAPAIALLIAMFRALQAQETASDG